MATVAAVRCSQVSQPAPDVLNLNGLHLHQNLAVTPWTGGPLMSLTSAVLLLRKRVMHYESMLGKYNDREWPMVGPGDKLVIPSADEM